MTIAGHRSVPGALATLAGGHADRFLCLQVVGPAMRPDLAPNDVVIVDTSDTNPGRDGIFAIWDGATGSTIIKCVQVVDRAARPPRIRCRSSNPAYPPFDLTLDGDTWIIGRVKHRISAL